MLDLEFMEHIGHGDHSEVSKMRRRSDNKLVVCKKIKYVGMTEKEKQHLVEEVNILSKMKSTHVVKYLDHFINKATFEILIITQYCEGGDLDSFLNTTKNTGARIPEESIWKIFMQVSLAVCEIHNRREGRVIHRDIRPANIFLDAQQNVKLGDFGLAKRINNEDNFCKTRMDEAYYMSPEQLKDGIFTERTDIWAIGCLLYQMAALSLPFPGDNQMQVAMRIRSNIIHSLPLEYSKELNRVIKWCLMPNPADRPTAEDLVHIPAIEKLIRSKRLSENINILNFREKELLRKEKELEERQNVVTEKERLMDKDKSGDRYTTMRPSTTRLPFKPLDNLL